MTNVKRRLLADDEPHPVEVRRMHGSSPFFLTCDHGGRMVPRKLGDLGLPPEELERHIAWDIGVAAVSRKLSDLLDAPLVEQVYSRLVVDCNRDSTVDSSIPEISELTRIPGNLALSEVDRAARRDEIFMPYHNRITAELDRRAEAGQETVLIAMHSFTPVFKGIARPWHIGVLYNRKPAFARIVLRSLEAEGDLTVGDNEPYHVSDATDFGIPVHGERRGLDHVELEIRQDLIGDECGQAAWAERLSRLLPKTHQMLRADTTLFGRRASR